MFSGVRGSWLRHYATSRKVASWNPDIIGYFQFTYSFQQESDPGIY
jgi:hypothetical protein